MSHTVLVVDDEPNIFNALRRTLHGEPYEMLHAANGEEAESLLDDRNVDVAIVDMHMPGMSGTQLLARMRQRWPDVVRIMLTGDASVDLVVNAVNNGEIFRFFVKPADESELIVAIRDAIDMREGKHVPTAELQDSPEMAEIGPAPSPVIELDAPADDDVESLLKQIQTELGDGPA